MGPIHDTDSAIGQHPGPGHYPMTEYTYLGFRPAKRGEIVEIGTVSGLAAMMSTAEGERPFPGGDRLCRAIGDGQPRHVWRSETVFKKIAVEPQVVTAQRYQDMLEVLPPARWIGGAFLVGEAMSHDDNGQARYAYYFRRGDQHFHGADLTVAEFEAKHGGR